MSHIHWVTRQNKLETPKEKDEVNKREVHECDVRTRDPDAMVVPPTPKPNPSTGRHRPSSQVVKTLCLGFSVICCLLLIDKARTKDKTYI